MVPNVWRALSEEMLDDVLVPGQVDDLSFLAKSSAKTYFIFLLIVISTDTFLSALQYFSGCSKKKE